MTAFGHVPEEFSDLMGGSRITAGLLRRGSAWKDHLNGRGSTLWLGPEYHHSYYHINSDPWGNYTVGYYDAHPNQAVPGNTILTSRPKSLEEAKAVAEEDLAGEGGQWLSRPYRPGKPMKDKLPPMIWDESGGRYPFPMPPHHASTEEGTDQFAEPEDHLIDPLRLRRLPKDINEAVPDAPGLLNSRDELGWPGMLPGEEVGAAARGVGRAVKNLST